MKCSHIKMITNTFILLIIPADPVTLAPITDLTVSVTPRKE
jgi:hypothetical protein